MTQTRPQLDEDLAAAVREYADTYHYTFTTAVKILLYAGLAQQARQRKEETQ